MPSLPHAPALAGRRPPGRGRRRTACLAAGLALAPAACRDGGAAAARGVAPVVEDPDWAGGEPVPALEATVEVRDASEGGGPIPGLPPGGRPWTERARKRPAATQRWLLGGDRAAFFPGGAHGDRAFVLTAGGDHAAVREGAAALGVWPHRRLADVVEGGITHREDCAFEHDPGAPDGRRSGREVWRETLRATCRARTGRMRRRETATLTVWSAAAGPGQEGLARLAIEWIGLSHLHPPGRAALGAMRAAGGVPLAWEAAFVAPETGAPATRLRGAVRSIRPARAPRSAFAVAGARRAVPPRPAAGTDGDRAVPGGAGELLARNRGPFHLWLFVDGVRMAEVPAQAEARVAGLPEGYYRVFARTPLGTWAAPPRDLYLPGVATFAP